MQTFLLFKVMWSDRYNYYNIQFDENFSQKLATDEIVAYLQGTEWFLQKDHQTFTNSESFPWVEIILVETYNGNYSTSSRKNKFTTLIAIVCSKGEGVDQQIYLNAFREVANKLNWRLFLEEDDDGNENVEL